MYELVLADSCVANDDEYNHQNVGGRGGGDGSRGSSYVEVMAE